MNKIQKYWNNENQKSITKYYYSTTKEQKDLIFSNELYNCFLFLIKTSLFKYTSKIDQDDTQELLIFINQTVLPKIDEDKLQSVFSYIWISLKNKIYNLYEERKINYVSSATGNITEFDYYLEPDEIDELKEDERKNMLRFIILNEIDNKIVEQEVLNKKATIFLILLKEYAIANEYDCRGFRNYCCLRMNISSSSFSNLCSVLRIVNNDFYKDVIDERKVTIDKANKYNKLKNN